MKAYKHLASIYDKSCGRYSPKYYSFIKRILPKYNCKRGSVLDLACGTGELIQSLAKDWEHVVGLDISEEMLKVAATKLKDFDNVRFIKADFAEFELAEKFDLILSCFDSLNYAGSLDDVSDCFKNVYVHLKPGGLFVFDIISERLCRQHNRIANTFNLEDTSYTTHTRYDEKERCLYTTFQFQNDGFKEVHRQIPIEYPEAVSLLKETGFEVISVFSNLYSEPVTEHSLRCFFITKR